MFQLFENNDYSLQAVQQVYSVLYTGNVSLLLLAQNIRIYRNKVQLFGLVIIKSH